MKRILVIGICGAGKSTFSRKLAKILSLPLIHLDKEFWQPGWEMPTPQSWIDKLESLLARSEWIMDGNYSSTFELRLRRADTVFYLDYSRWRALWGVLKRVARSRGQVRADMAPGCPERLNLDFLKYVWSFHRNHRERVEKALLNHESSIQLYRFKSPKELEVFFRQLNAKLEVV